MKRLDFTTLRLFIAIADSHSLTRAAAREHLALAAVSKRISDLETQLSTTLLYRRPRGVELTPAGHALLHHARHMLDSLDHLTADLSEYSVGVRGHVRMHANTSAVIEFLPEDLSDFTWRYPQIRIDMQERLSHEIIAAVREGLTDIGIFSAHIPAAELQTRAYRRDRLALVTASDHPLAGRDSIAFAETLDYDFIGLEQDSSLHSLLQQDAQRLKRALRMRIQVRSFEGICRMIDRGMGVGILPARAVSAYRGSLSLATVPLSDTWAERELVIGMRDYDSLPLIAREMVDHLTTAGERADTLGQRQSRAAEASTPVAKNPEAETPEVGAQSRR
ncbi:LysR family transcriptional regulator [Salinicola endophyticus]|uniref:LysR family transcriptional regulator n=1 Tax=Salinicola endophyticus TaxID=1949083 RepID=A0ABY8FJQ3_9GAMM|nr:MULTISPECIES: LysR family transcriptional regulator [Salinicola]WFF43033.1 LysR family transcriptional regulator [Salinicola endophyticus]